MITAETIDVPMKPVIHLLSPIQATRHALQCDKPECTCHHPCGFVHDRDHLDEKPCVLVGEEMGQVVLRHYRFDEGGKAILTKEEIAPPVIQPGPKKPLVLVESEPVKVVALKDPRFVTGAELEALEFPEPKYLIPGILAEGYAILAGRPKLGKSWLALHLGTAVASGGYALGRAELRAIAGEVLYLALEDRLRRIKRRLEMVLGDTPFPKNLLIAESWPRIDQGGLDELEGFLKEHQGCRLVVIDTLAKVKPANQKNHDPYASDMAIGGALQSLAHRYNTSLLVVHHTRKSAADDPLDEVSGTTGITGSADAIMVLKRGRGKADGTLSLTGRDIEERELALSFHGEDGAWTLLGDAEEFGKSQQRQEIIEILRDQVPRTPKEIADLLGKRPNNIKNLLWKMGKEGAVKSHDGKYSL